MLSPKPTKGKTDWFVRDRFGMFIHWGLYAMPARHEWVKQHEEMTDEQYEPYFRLFNPRRFDPDRWADLAAAAGMKYMVITSKHHDGFCLWDTQHTDYKATNTPWGKDLLTAVVDAFRSRGLKVGFYYSLIDWHHPDFVIDRIHALRNHSQREQLNAGRDMSRYRAYMKNQVRELLSDFGKIDIIWYDFSYPGADGKGRDDWDSAGLEALSRSLQPDIIINNRLDLPSAADIYTPEQVQPRGWVHVDGEPVVWETCQTFSGSWGYHRDEATWKSPGQLIRMLVNTVATGGNLLMNVGPTAMGELDARAEAALGVYEKWMTEHSEAIYGCTASALPAPADCRLTQNGDALYCHIFAYPFKHLYMDGIGERIAYAEFLHDGSEIHVSVDESNGARLDLPVVQPPCEVPVVKLYLKA
ncbi:MAG: alpha-L-fucosidase [Chloroflexi bacterium]|nr:alpha-L-fucosidase [Chloroflexota bacterium]MCY4246313.1 alpha-L-fucosidase [Chloroflexota bacterium]